jgi:hypothetical protein
VLDYIGVFLDDRTLSFEKWLEFSPNSMPCTAGSGGTR